MTAFLTPAIAIANRMSFTAKLFSAVLIFLIPFVFVLSLEIANSNANIKQDERQLKGLDVAIQLKPIALMVAKHRGTMAQFLSGAADKEPAVLALEKDIDSELSDLSKLASEYHYELSTLNNLQSKWQSLKFANNKTAVGPVNFQNHSDFIADIHHTISVVSSDFDLVLQSKTKDHYMVNTIIFDIPRLQEQLGQLRGKGASALTDKTVIPSERVVLSSMFSTTQHLGNSLDEDIELLFKDSTTREHLNKESNNYHNAIQQFFDFANKQVILADDITINSADFFEAGSKAIEAISAFDIRITQEFKNSIKSEHDKKRFQNFVLIIVSLVTVTIGIYFSLGILTSLNVNATSLNDASHKLRNGDFSTRILVHSEDTLGDAAKSLTQMIHSISALLNTIQSSAHDVNTLSIQLQKVADTSKDELDQQSLQTQQAASAATQMAATVREVARSCVEVSTAADIARDSAIEGQTRVNEAIGKINALGTNVEEAKNIITDLQRDVIDIAAVLEVIRSIADQTNLLALNAAIEAARAGEQGRGFAVVADEVRTLAKRTQDSTAEIRNVIEKLQGRATNAVNIIHQSFTSTQDSVVSAASAGESLNKIVKGVEILRDLNTQIATSAEEQAAVAEQMSQNTQQLSDSAENILDEIEKTVTFSTNLRSSAMSLLDNAMKFKT